MSAENFFSDFNAMVVAFGWPLAVTVAVVVARRLALLDRDTRLHAFLMFAHFFLVISSFWMLKPVKKTLLLTHYADGLVLFGWKLSAAQVELVAKEANMVVALFAALAFSVLARRFRREAFVTAVTVAFMLCYVVFALFGDGASAFGTWAFYLLGDLFVTAMVASFFAFLNDSEDPLAARRLYGLVVLGGVLGGAFGSTVIARHAQTMGVAEVAGAVSIVCGAIFLLAIWAGRIVARHPPPERTTPLPHTSHPRRLQEAFAGASLTFHSRYTMMIVAIVGIYEMSSTLLDYQFTATVLHYVDKSQIGIYFSNVFAFTNVIAVGVQLLLTPWILKRFGVGTGLLLLPLLLSACVAGFWIAPVLLIGSLLSTADNAFAYSLNQSAKEVLYVPLPRDYKYRAKAFIDIFMLRFAKALAVAAGLVASSLFAGFENLHWLSALILALLAAWIIVVRMLAREYRMLEYRAAKLVASDVRANIQCEASAKC